METIVFAAIMTELLTKERGTFRNILKVGLFNCGKTFLSSPLHEIFNTFNNQANDKYAWLRAEKEEIVFLIKIEHITRRNTTRNTL